MLNDHGGDVGPEDVPLSGGAGRGGGRGVPQEHGLTGTAGLAAVLSGETLQVSHLHEDLTLKGERRARRDLKFEGRRAHLNALVEVRHGLRLAGRKIKKGKLIYMIRSQRREKD